jgi:hypothetical protein
VIKDQEASINTVLNWPAGRVNGYINGIAVTANVFARFIDGDIEIGMLTQAVSTA